MEIDVTYLTVSEMGDFHSKAKLNSISGEVFEIEQVEDSDAILIEEIFHTYVILNYCNNDFELDVDSETNKIIDYNQSYIYKLLNSQDMKENLDKSLE